jgi:hypothetical protein
MSNSELNKLKELLVSVSKKEEALGSALDKIFADLSQNKGSKNKSFEEKLQNETNPRSIGKNL